MFPKIRNINNLNSVNNYHQFTPFNNSNLQQSPYHASVVSVPMQSRYQNTQVLERFMILLIYTVLRVKKRECKHNFKWPFMEKWEYPIHNGTLCESGIAIFVRRVSWNYAYSLFKSMNVQSVRKISISRPNISFFF